MSLTWVSDIEVEDDVQNEVNLLYSELCRIKDLYKEVDVQVREGKTLKEIRELLGKDVFLFDIYTKIKNNTMMSLPWLSDLYVLVEHVKDLSMGSLLEVGSWRGGSGGLIALQAKKHNISNNIYLCDTFKGIPKAGEEDTVYKGGEHSDTSLNTVEDLLFNKLKFKDQVSILKGIFPDKTSNKIPKKEKFRFCHIDVDVYKSAEDVFEWVWPRMVSGGIVLYDDFGHGNTPGIRKHVEEHKSDEDKVIFCSPFMRAIIIKL